MGIFVADQNQVVFQYESGLYATPSGGAHWIGLVTDHTPTDAENVQTIRYAGTGTRNVDILINTTKEYEGTFTYHPQDFRMLNFALGSVVDSGSPSPYNHLISETNSDDKYVGFSGTNHNFPAFTIIDSKKNAGGDGAHQVRRYRGAIVNTFSFTATQGEPTVCEINYMAQNLLIGSKTADIPAIADEDTTRPYLWTDVKYHLPSGTVIEEITEVSFSVNNNLDRRHYDNGSKVVQNITPLNREYEVSLTLDANSTWGQILYQTYWQGGSSFNSMIEAVLSTGSEQAFFVMSGCKITAFESPSPAEGINEYTATITPETVIVSTDDLIEKHNLF